MKTTSDDLFVLIKSLTKQEKRYFKIHASKHVIGSQNKYLKVFDAIDAQENYDEQALRKKFAKEPFIKQMFVIKNYLSELILKTLTAYHSEKNSEALIRSWIQSFDVLFDKGLYEHCAKLLARAQKLATQSENFPLLIEVLQKKHQLCKSGSAYYMDEKEIDELIGMKKQATEKLANLVQYEELHDKLQNRILKKGWYVRKDEEIKREYSSIVKNDFFSSESLALSERSRMYYYMNNSIFSYLKGDAAHSYDYSKKLVNMLEQSPDVATSYMPEYISGLNNLVFTSMRLGNFGEAFAYIHKLKSLKVGSEMLESKLFRAACLPELIMHNYSQQTDAGLKVSREVETKLVQYEKYMPRQDVYYFLYNISCLNFKAGKFTEASKYLFKITNDPEAQAMSDIQANSRILNLIVKFELDEVDLLPYIIRSTYRFLLKQNRYHKFENIILSFIRKLPSTTDKYLVQEFVSLKSELQAMSKDIHEKNAIDFFGIIPWLDRRLNAVQSTSDLNL